MSFGEFVRRGMNSGATSTTLVDDVLTIAYGPEKERRKLQFRYSEKYNRTLLECLRLDLKVVVRIARRRLTRALKRR